MYKKILVTLENSRTDEAILRHIEWLAKPLGSSLLLGHVADGWMARHRELLRAQVHSGITAEQYLDEHITVGQALRGAVTASDAAAAAAAAAPNRVLPRAKAKLIKTMRTLLDVLDGNAEFPREMLAAVVGPLAQAAERAQADALARRAAPAAPTPAS